MAYRLMSAGDPEWEQIEKQKEEREEERKRLEWLIANPQPDPWLELLELGDNDPIPVPSNIRVVVSSTCI